MGVAPSPASTRPVTVVNTAGGSVRSNVRAWPGVGAIGPGRHRVARVRHAGARVAQPHALDRHVARVQRVLPAGVQRTAEVAVEVVERPRPHRAARHRRGPVIGEDAAGDRGAHEGLHDRDVDGRRWPSARPAARRRRTTSRRTGERVRTSTPAPVTGRSVARNSAGAGLVPVGKQPGPMAHTCRSTVLVDRPQELDGVRCWAAASRRRPGRYGRAA